MVRYLPVVARGVRPRGPIKKPLGRRRLAELPVQVGEATAQELGLLHGVIHAPRIERPRLGVGSALRLHPRPAVGRQRRQRRVVLRDRIAQDLSAQNEIAHPFNGKPAQEIELLKQAGEYQQQPLCALGAERGGERGDPLSPLAGGFSGLAANATTSRTAAFWRQPSGRGIGKGPPQICTRSNLSASGESHGHSAGFCVLNATSPQEQVTQRNPRLI
jgi:hypothetical protein